MKRSTMLLLTTLAVAGTAGGCRGTTSEDPPIHLAPDMDWQPHRRPQQEAPLVDGKPIFADKRAARPIVSGTIVHSSPADFARREDPAYAKGLDPNGRPLRRMPVEAVLEAHGKKSIAEVLPRGEERFNIYCAPCHDMSGSGQGLVIQRSAGGFPPPTPFNSSQVVGMADGQLFEVISHGIRNMPGYATQIPVADRWAIALWVRVLSKSQGATLEDVPAAERAKIAPAPGQEGAK